MEEIDYLNALKTRGTLILSILSANVPAGSIKHIQLPQKTDHSLIFSFRDIPGKNSLSIFDSEIPLLAENHVLYEGQPILLVANRNKDHLDKIMGELRIEFESNYTIKNLDNPNSSDIARMKHYRRGDSPKALKNASKVIEEEFHFPGLLPRICGDVGAWAQYKDDRIDLYVTSGWPHNVRKTVAEMLKIDTKRIRVHGLSPGHSNDSLVWFPSALAAYACLGAYLSGKPVLLKLNEKDRQKIFPKSLPVKARFRTGLDKAGRILGREINLDLEAGAFPVAPGFVLDRTCVSSLSLYGCPNFTVTGRIITTNRIPADISYGAGITPVLAAAETHATHTALAAGKDPLTFRRDYCKAPYEHGTGIREKKNLIKIEELLDKVAAASDFTRKFGAFELNRKKAPRSDQDNSIRKGIGLAVSFADSTLPGLAENEVAGTIRLHLDTEGRLSIFTSAVPEHEATREEWKRTAGAILGASPESINIPLPDTDYSPDSGPMMLSRNTTVIRDILEKAAGSIQRRRFRSPLPISIKRSFSLPKSLTWDTNTLKGTLFHRITWAAWVVEVTFDPVLLRPVVQGIWGSIHCGRVLHTQAARCALEEELYTTLGHIRGAGLLPPVNQVAPISIDFLKSARKETLGLSNTVTGGIISAYLSAVEQASNHTIQSIPVSDRLFHRHGGTL